MRTTLCLGRTVWRKARLNYANRNFTFSFAGPRKLDDIIKKELLSEKSGPELEELWQSYHKEKDSVIGLVADGKSGLAILSRATVNPFFIQPVFREDGFFMLISQFQAPSHFLLAYLEDYKMDSTAATPLLTASVFADFAESRDVSLVRCDILNKNINDDEAKKVVDSLLENYKKEDSYGGVKTFNEKPDDFDIDDFISRMNDRWNKYAS